MPRIAYVNGRYLPLSEASVNVEDRGYQFADGIYEVLALAGGAFLDEALHMARLERSLREIGIAPPMAPAALRLVLREVVRRNRVSDGLLYLQVTRGVARREHAFPPASPRTGRAVPPALVVTCRAGAPPPADVADWAASAITAPDERWARCDVKSIALLPNVLAKERARRAGAAEAILVDRDGLVTEGASTTVWVVDAGGTLRTRPLTHAILPGCTRAALIGELAAAGIGFEERAVSEPELRAAREVFITSATSWVRPVVRLDGAPVGDGATGPVARRLFALMRHPGRGLAGAAPAR
ncbi:MAG: D-amino-acid transaminase [Janthinobacterium lividum]